MTIPDDATIRQLDGPALTRLALALALAPTGFITCGHDIFLQTDLPGISRQSWRPHTNVTQARALFFDTMGARWKYCVGYYPGEPPGLVRLCDGPHTFDEPFCRETCPFCREPCHCHQSEAMALLRCACRARAAQRREEAVTHD